MSFRWQMFRLEVRLRWGRWESKSERPFRQRTLTPLAGWRLLARTCGKQELNDGVVTAFARHL